MHIVLATDGQNFDDIYSLIYLLKSGVNLSLIIITGNGWADPGVSLSTYTLILKWFGRGDIPVIAGSLYSLKDYKENYEIDYKTQGQMFKRTIPEENLFDTSFLYSYLSWLPPSTVDQKAYENNYMEKIMNHINEFDKFTVLSLGALTDIAKIIKELKIKNELDKIEKIIHLGGNLDTRGSVTSIDRSFCASYNNYLDPDAVNIVLENVGERTYWISAKASGSIQFSYHDVRKIVEEFPTPEGIWLYLLTRARATHGTDIPENQIPDSLFIWDIIAVLILIYPEFITSVKRTKIKSNIESSVCVNRYDDRTDVIYSYNNTLANFNECEDGNITNIIEEVDKEGIETSFYYFLAKQANNALCDLQEPLGCYQGKVIKTLNDLDL